MRKFAVLFAFAASLALTGATMWKAEAAPAAGAAPVAVSAWTINNIMHAACRGRGARCPHGWVWNGHRCRPC